MKLRSGRRRCLDVPLNSSPALEHADFAVFHRLPHGTFYLIIQNNSNETFPSSDPQGAPLPAGLHTIDHSPWSAAVQLIFCPYYSPSIETVSLFYLKDATGDHPGNFSKGRVNDTHCFPIGCIAIISSQKAIRLLKQGLSFVNPCWLLPVTSSPSCALDKESRRICSIAFPGTDMRMTDLRFLRASCLPFLKIGLMFVFYQSSGTSHDCHNLSKIL